MTREQKERIEQAMRIVSRLMYELEEEGKVRLAKRLNTVLGKLYDIEHIA